MPSNVSLVAMTYNRDALRANNLLASLSSQSYPLAKIIIINQGNPLRLDLPRNASLIRVPREPFNKSVALNYGLRRVDTRYTIFTDIDFIHSPNMVEMAMVELERGDKFILAEAMYLPQSIQIKPPFDWPGLVYSAASYGRKASPGTIQAARTDWFRKVGGYDEAFDGGLGGMDDDMWIRARKDGKEIVWLEQWDRVYCLHQWHPISPLKGKCSGVFSANPEIYKNGAKEK